MCCALSLFTIPTYFSVQIFKRGQKCRQTYLTRSGSFVCHLQECWAINRRNVLSANSSPLHYWLRPIKRGQFRFANFAPQMSLSLSKSLSFASIPLVKIGENSKNSIFFILEVQFHHEGGLSESRYLELFFSAWSIFSPCKSASAEPPFNPFWSLAKIKANVQKSLKGGSVKANFLHDENIDHAEKKSSK